MSKYNQATIIEVPNELVMKFPFLMFFLSLGAKQGCFPLSCRLLFSFLEFLVLSGNVIKLTKRSLTFIYIAAITLQLGILTGIISTALREQ